MVAGEASGDLHGARMLTELQQLVPGLTAYGLGGDELGAAGFEHLAHSREISVVGFTEALRILAQAREIFRSILAEVDRRGTRHAVLIDSPDFNLRLAKQLHRRGVRVYYYISPQLWAWRRGRVKTVARDVDRMLVLFPFEVDFYRRHGVEVVHVGHPLIDEVPRLEQAWDRSQTRDEGPAEDEARYTVALLPGSRQSEVRSHLPILQRAVDLLAAELPIAVRLIQAPTVPAKLFDPILGDDRLAVEAIRSDRFEAIAGSHLAICASGTATLEVALLETPMVVIYRTTRATAFLGRWLIRVPYAAMVNLVLGRRAVPELIQEDAEPREIARAAAGLLRDRDRIANLRQDYRELREKLGTGGASRRAAAEIAHLIEAEGRA